MSQTFTYRGGVSDRYGRGFLGFSQRDVYGPGSRHQTITYQPTTKTTLGAGYIYGRAMSPTQIRTDVDTPNPRQHHYDVTNFYVWANLLPEKTYRIAEEQTKVTHYDCPSTSGSACTGPARNLGGQSDDLKYDTYGRLLERTVMHLRATSGFVSRVDSTYYSYRAADTANWLLQLFDETIPALFKSNLYTGPVSPSDFNLPATQLPTASETASRKVRFTSDWRTATFGRSRLSRPRGTLRRT